MLSPPTGSSSDNHQSSSPPPQGWRRPQTRPDMGRTTEMSKRRFWIPALVVTLVAVGLIAQASAGNGPGSTVLKFKTMVGTVAPYTGAANAIRGVAGAGAPWSIDTANGKLEENGDLRIKVTGLIITGTGANPVPEFRAVVSCQSIATGHVLPLRRVADVHRERPREHHERLLLSLVPVAAPFGAGLVAPGVRAGVGEAGQVAQLGDVARRLAGLVRARAPHELVGTDDPEAPYTAESKNSAPPVLRGAPFADHPDSF